MGATGQESWVRVSGHGPTSEVWGFFLLLMLPSSPAPEPTEQEAEEELRADGQDPTPGVLLANRVIRVS